MIRSSFAAMMYGGETVKVAPLSPVELETADTLVYSLQEHAERDEPAERPALKHKFTERYEELGALGEGGMGVVKLYRDQRIGRSVAVKEMHAKLANHKAAQARFVREVRVQGQLEHPAIVPVYDLGMNEQGAAYFSMKRVRGMSLEDILWGLHRGDTNVRARFTPRKLLSAFASVCLAVQYAHERGVLHRDLKPANIMLGNFGEVYVLDWGIAKITAGDSQPRQRQATQGVDAPLAEAAATHPGTLFGTPGYLAPEIVLGDDDQYGPEGDVYSLGAILFEILTLERLHDVDSLNQLVAMFVQDQEVRPSLRVADREIPPELDAICARACSYDPQKRFASARALHDAIDKYLEGQRDTKLRVQLADAHTKQAQQAAERVRNDDDSLNERRRAMQEIGRALALDPGNPGALAIMEELLLSPPPILPAEVQLELDRSTARHHRHSSKIGVISYLSLFLYLPLALAHGIVDARPLWGMYALALVCTVISAYAMRQKRPTTGPILAVMVCSNLMFLCLWPMFGPLIMLPTILVANTTSFAMHLDKGARLLALACGALAIVLPVALEVTGVVAPSYRFTGDTMVTVAGMVELQPMTILLLTIATLGALFTGAMVVYRVRDALREAELRLYTYTWHLREFVPQTVRAATDPTVARTAS